MICHCQTCRRVSGGVAIAWFSVPSEALAITKGKPKRHASSPGIQRQFCNACGTQLTYARDDDATSTDVATTTLDNPNAFPPGHHSWLSHDLDWVKFADGAPTFPKGRYDGGD